MKKKGLKSVLIFLNVFVFLLILNLVFIKNDFVYLKIPFIFHQHFAIDHREVKQYTLPVHKYDGVQFNSSNVSIYQFFNYPNSSRGIAKCDNFESEISCEELQKAAEILNETINSSKYLVVDLPLNIQDAIKTLHFAFVLSVSTIRRLYVSKTPIILPSDLVQIPNNLNQYSLSIYTPSKIKSCEYTKILSDDVQTLRLEGSWEISNLLLTPKAYELIPSPFQTHGMFLLARWLKLTNPISFPSNQLQIGIALEFKPDERVFIRNIKRLSEGYSNWTLHIWSPSDKFIHSLYKYKYLEGKINKISKWSFATNNLVQCDKFIGSLGFFSSHFMNQIRGRGGIWLDPRNSMIIETSSSQSGLLFSMKNKNVNELMCPGGMKEFEHFLAFHAI